MKPYNKGFEDGVLLGYKQGVLVENKNIVNDLNNLLGEIAEKTPIGYLLTEHYIKKAIKQFEIKSTP